MNSTLTPNRMVLGEISVHMEISKFINALTSIDRCSFISRVDIFLIQTGSLGNGQETLKQ